MTNATSRPVAGETYTLAGGFPSRWECVKVLANRNGFKATMKNVATGECRHCSEPSINAAGLIEWKCSKEI